MFEQRQKHLDGDEIKKTKKYTKEELEGNYDLITFFVGILLIFLGGLDNIKEVPQEFIIGATLAGLFFAVSDFILIKDDFSKFENILNRVLIFSGILSIFLDPVLCIMYYVLCSQDFLN
ncbi:hypothetical protein [Peribacillus frigoritolerans]|uniref:hypothetical protein n=1 Tax=Peribacillus frigoritolerans TaxID=450367 RepID=UPI003D05D9F8